MYRLAKRPPFSRKRGLTLIEVLIALALLSLLSVITVEGMIAHARLAKSNLELQRMAENARRLTDAIQTLALDATSVQISSGPSGPATVLTISKPDPANSAQVITKQYAFINRDGNAATIKDNVVLERDVNTPGASTGKEVIHYCSPQGDTPIFQQVEEAGRPLYEMTLRLGDRTYPAGNTDNAVTGNGYQSYLLQASFSIL